jgi:hypothetical protein
MSLRRSFQIFLLPALRAARTGAVQPSSAASSSTAAYTWHVQPPPPIAAPSTTDAESKAHPRLSFTSAIDRAKQILRSAQSTERPARFRELAVDITDEVQVRGRAAVQEGQEWLDSGAPGSAKVRIKAGVQFLLNRIDQQETRLRQVHQFVEEAKRLSQPARQQQPSVAHVLSVHHPAALPSTAASEYLRSYLATRLSHHTTWTYVCVALLPVTACAVILPGPNVFLAWNAFRLYGHYQAKLGVTELQQMQQAVDGDMTTNQVLTSSSSATAVDDDASRFVRLEFVVASEAELEAVQPVNESEDKSAQS